MPATLTLVSETRTLPQLFARTAAQVTEVLYPEQTIPKALMKTLSIEGENPSFLLQNWLNVVIRTFYEKHLAFALFDVRQLGPKGKGWDIRIESTGVLIHAAAVAARPRLSCTAAEISGDEQSCRAQITLSNL